MGLEIFFAYMKKQTLIYELMSNILYDYLLSY